MRRYPITPMGKPRMTQRDKWAKRPVVERYFAFRDEVRLRKVSLPEGGAHVTFVLPMPKSWSKKRREQMRGQPHQQKPDVDNLAKGLMDAVFADDCRVWDARWSKVWGEQGEIIVKGASNG